MIKSVIVGVDKKNKVPVQRTGMHPAIKKDVNKGKRKKK
jgi:hypothetical protein